MTGVTDLSQPRGSRYNDIVACCIGERTAVGRKGDRVNGAAAVVGELTAQLAGSYVPKANCKRRRINRAPTDQMSTVRRPGEIALAVAENFVPEREGAEQSPIGDVPHFDCVQSVSAASQELTIGRERDGEHVRSQLCADG